MKIFLKQTDTCPICQSETKHLRRELNYILRKCNTCGLKIRHYNSRLHLMKYDNKTDWQLGFEGTEGCGSSHHKRYWKSDHIRLQEGIGYWKTYCPKCKMEIREYYVYGIVFDIEQMFKFDKTYLSNNQKKSLRRRNKDNRRKIKELLSNINIDHDFLS